METPARYYLAPNVILLQPPQRVLMVDGQPEAEYRVDRPANMTSRKQVSRKGSRRSKPPTRATLPAPSTRTLPAREPLSASDYEKLPMMICRKSCE